MFAGNSSASLESNATNTFIRIIDDVVGCWHLDEGDGTTAYDNSGNNNDGTIHGASWTEGKYGSALNFDGDDDYVEVADSDSLRPNEITILAWIKPSSLTNDKHIVTKSAVGTIYCSYGFRLHNNKLQYWMYDGSQDIWTTSTDVLPDTSWHYVGVTWKKPTVTFYIDDEIAGTAEIDTNPVYGSYPVAIGTRLYTSYAFPFSGIIDEVRIYNKALSEEEIADLYNNYGYTTTNYPGKVLVCKYASTPPSWSSFGSWMQTSGTTISTQNQSITLNTTNVSVGIVKKIENYNFADGSDAQLDRGKTSNHITISGVETSNSKDKMSTLNNIMDNRETVSISGLPDSSLNTDYHIRSLSWQHIPGTMNVYRYNIVFERLHD